MPHTAKPVSVQVGYPSPDAATVTVDPAEVTIYYNRKGGTGSTALARKVRWEVTGVQDGDCVIFRPKESLDAWTKTIFVPPAGKQYFEATSNEKSIACDPPVFGVDPGPSFPIRWEYDVVVHRGDEEIGSLDPVIVIVEDP